jgi:hypothetical protein
MKNEKISLSQGSTSDRRIQLLRGYGRKDEDNKMEGINSTFAKKLVP